MGSLPCPYAGDRTSHTAELLRHSHAKRSALHLLRETSGGLVCFAAVQGSVYLHSLLLAPQAPLGGWGLSPLGMPGGEGGETYCLP